MGFDLRLDMKMSQQLVMTPQLQQAIKLLQLSRMDLIDAVRDELMDNPLLEESSEITSSEAKVESAKEVAQREKLTEAKDVELNDQVGDAKEQIDWESYFENYSSPTPGTSGQRLRDDDMPGYEATLTRS
ncbi:MAG: RNA polymerase sigma-54 factor, partial [Bradymonadia bacterium]